MTRSGAQQRRGARLSSHVGPWGDHAPPWAPDLDTERIDGHAHVGADLGTERIDGHAYDLGAVPAPLVPRGTVG